MDRRKLLEELELELENMTAEELAKSLRDYGINVVKVDPNGPGSIIWKDEPEDLVYNLNNNISSSFTLKAKVMQSVSVSIEYSNSYALRLLPLLIVSGSNPYSTLPFLYFSLIYYSLFPPPALDI